MGSTLAHLPKLYLMNMKFLHNQTYMAGNDV